MKFITLLRGINVGGKNKVAMPELRQCLENAGFDNVVTYINSGNIIFESNETNLEKLTNIIELSIKDRFDLQIPCLVIQADELITTLVQAPEWWDKEGGKHNAIFVMAPMDAKTIVETIGEIKPTYERVAISGRIIFWSAPLETFSRTRYSKIVKSNYYQYITIRNSKTTKKLSQICQSN